MAGGLRLAAIGALVGTAIAAAATRLMSSLLYEVGSLDVVAFVGAAMIVLGIALAASAAAAWRAAAVRPVIALRHH